MPGPAAVMLLYTWKPVKGVALSSTRQTLAIQVLLSFLPHLQQYLSNVFVDEQRRNAADSALLLIGQPFKQQ